MKKYKILSRAMSDIADNYIPIALSPVISIIFEYCILNKYDHLFVSDKLQFGFLRKFYASVNAIITHSTYGNEDVKLRLHESFSLPLLTYGLNVIYLSAGQSNKLNITWNNVYRMIFGMKPCESVNEIVSVWSA